ncbi:MAG: ADP-forming succinate--CoA ligase subunit beta [Proteobacteria bacterium]|nr:ADP-forming succinate--CoA ligase subunit beta [Pseudomonadota bacterium]
MKIHEYQAKKLFAEEGVPIPRGRVAFSVEEALDVAKSLEYFPVVVKAQIHAGGRGKGGGVKLAASPDEVRDHAGAILGMNLVTHQTGPQGQVVRKLLVEQGLDIRKEMYLSLVPDRATANIVIMASLEGGMDIEEVAEHNPEKIIKVFVDPLSGLQPYHCRQVAYALDLQNEAVKSITATITRLYAMFIRLDCSLVEINPLVLTGDNTVVALDAKVDFDDSALYRHPDIKEMRDEDEEAPLEVEASKFNLNYINLDGNIGNIVNGAGLAMATMDIIKIAGAEPANFLDVGGGATSEMVENAFRILLMDTKVKGILINIFGGILRCDIFAEGVVRAAKNTGIDIPVVIRMEGTNVDLGRKILAESGLKLETASDLKDAARKIASIIKG